MSQAIKELESFDASVRKCEDDANKYRNYEMTLNMPETKF